MEEGLRNGVWTGDAHGAVPVSTYTLLNLDRGTPCLRLIARLWHAAEASKLGQYR